MHLLGSPVELETRVKDEQLAYTGANEDAALFLGGLLLVGGVSMVAANRLLARRAIAG